MSGFCGGGDFFLRVQKRKKSLIIVGISPIHNNGFQIYAELSFPKNQILTLIVNSPLFQLKKTRIIIICGSEVR